MVTRANLAEALSLIGVKQPLKAADLLLPLLDCAEPRYVQVAYLGRARRSYENEQSYIALYTYEDGLGDLQVGDVVTCPVAGNRTLDGVVYAVDTPSYPYAKRIFERQS